MPKETSKTIMNIPNTISFLRLCLVPLFLFLLAHNNNLAAGLVFALAASTDFLDGLIARRFGMVTRLGQILDPLVDRALMISGVLGLVLLGRLPLWIVVLVFARDLCIIAVGSHLLLRHCIRIPVVFIGKVATAFLFAGFFLLIINLPQIPSLALIQSGYFPGFNAQDVSFGIWLVYCGLIFSCIATSIYARHAYKKLACKNICDTPKAV